MIKSTLLAVISATLLASTAAAPTTQPGCTPPHLPYGPKINVIFFSDTACTQSIPKTHYTRDIQAGKCVNDFHYHNGPPLYKSLIIDHIDDQFVGTNSALQVGNTNSKACNFTNSEKFSLASKHVVGKCQFIGIPQQGPGKPLLYGNEYQLAPLM